MMAPARLQPAKTKLRSRRGISKKNAREALEVGNDDVPVREIDGAADEGREETCGVVEEASTRSSNGRRRGKSATAAEEDARSGIAGHRAAPAKAVTYQ